MVTFRGSRTAMALGAVSFRISLTQASSRWGSMVTWATVTPTCNINWLRNVAIHL